MRRGLFDRDARVRLVTEATAGLPNVRCVGDEGLAVEVAVRERADVIVRSAHKELAGERMMAATNELMSGLTTILVMPHAATASISSTTVRSMVAAGEVDAAARLVPDVVAAALVGRVVGA